MRSRIESRVCGRRTPRRQPSSVCATAPRTRQKRCGGSPPGTSEQSARASGSPTSLATFGLTDLPARCGRCKPRARGRAQLNRPASTFKPDRRSRPSRTPHRKARLASFRHISGGSAQETPDTPPSPHHRSCHASGASEPIVRNARDGRRPTAQGKTPASWHRSSPGAPLGAPAHG
jgi:hypothetical protein